MSDAAKMLAAEEASRNDYHWLVSWSAHLHPSVIAELRKDGQTRCADCGEEADDDEIGVISDQTTIGCGPDGQAAIDRVKAHVLDTKAFGTTVVPSTFQLKGLKILSIREV